MNEKKKRVKAYSNSVDCEGGKNDHQYESDLIRASKNRRYLDPEELVLEKEQFARLTSTPFKKPV